MKMEMLSKRLSLFLAVLLVGCSTDKTSIESVSYPETAKVDQADDYYGAQVTDPYRWLEDDNSEETAHWVEAQNKVTFGFLNKIPFKEAIRARIEELYNYEKYRPPFKGGENYFFFKNDGLQNQDVLYIQKSPDDQPELFLDPNKLSEDGTVAISGVTISNDGKYLGYQVSVSGSDWREINVMDIESKELLSDKVEWVKFSGISWYKDGFFYSRYEQPAAGDELKSVSKFQKVYYHKIGALQAVDQLIYENKDDGDRNHFASVTEDERYLMVYGSKSTSGNSLYIKNIADPAGSFVTAVENFDNDHRVVGNEGDWLFIQTNLDAPNVRVVKVKSSQPQVENWEDVIPESENVLNSATGGGKIFASYLIDAKTSVKQFNLRGELERDIELPGVGTAAGFSAHNEEAFLFYTFTSFTNPATVYRYDIGSGESTLFRQPELKFDPADYQASQVFYESKDGTKVPMFIVHKKGLELNGKNPTLLYGYGGFNISLTPRFRSSTIVWLENGGIWAQPNLRGGGEYGETWHEAGTLLKKQNVFDDFIAAGEYLIANNYTSSDHLAIFGGSNGGLLVGACMTQRPELFKVAFPAVGVLDMLRYQNFTIGWAWATDYGTWEDSEEMFKYLYGYSPLHNLRDGVAYPSTMVTTADHDDRVVPAHSFKFAATLQEKHGGENPVLIRIETKAGHGAGKPTSKRIDEAADRFAFAWYNMGINPENLKSEEK